MQNFNNINIIRISIKRNMKISHYFINILTKIEFLIVKEVLPAAMYIIEQSLETAFPVLFRDENFISCN
jgi:hypothetical protein